MRFLLPALLLLATACAGSDPALAGAAVRAPDDGAIATTAPPAPAPGPSVTSTAPPATTSTIPARLDAGTVTIPAGGADLFAAAGGGGDPEVTIHEGIVLGVVGRDGAWLEVVTTCDTMAWVRESEVAFTPQPGVRRLPGTGFDFAEAVIVLDPGHGDRDWGAVGPSGLGEKTVNLDVAERTAALLAAPRRIDPVTRRVETGDEIPAAARVVLTRSDAGPNDGDYELGLRHRAEVANGAGADVLVSIHNNSVPQRSTEIPGTEVYYAVSAEGSDRLASLLYEELLFGFGAFEAPWSGGYQLGARARVDRETGDDYYGLLRRSEMAAAIVEGLYVSEAEQEALLRRDDVREAYAQGVYRALVRFLTTDEWGPAANAPEPFGDDAGTVNLSRCQIPNQR